VVFRHTGYPGKSLQVQWLAKVPVDLVAAPPQIRQQRNGDGMAS
jgi:hypothetical protein